VTRAIENAQTKVEAMNFDIRKQLLEYDNVMNKQREAIYGLRRQLLEGEDQKEYLMGIADDIMIDYVSKHASENTHPDEWDLDGLQTAVLRQFGFDFRAEGIDPSHLSSKDLETQLLAKAHERYDQKEAIISSAAMRYHERMLMLQIVDAQWKDHLLAMDHLKEGIGLRGYGQRDPLVEYKKESYELFEGLMSRIEEDTLRFLFLLQPVEEQKQAEQMERKRKRAEFVMSQQSSNGGDGEKQPVRRDASKVGRNDPCPCGSGKKYKKCHGGNV